MATYGNQKSVTDMQSLCSISKYSCYAAYQLLLWTTRDVYKFCETSDASNQASAVKTLCDMRDNIVDVLKLWLEFHVDSIAVVEISDQIHQLRLDAFRMIGDLRILFSATQRNVNVTSVFWAPPQNLLQSMKAMFDAETERIQQLLDRFGDSPSDLATSKALSIQFLDGLLLPLGQIAICDMINLNRRQAAVVLSYLNDPNERVVEFVKLWSKMLKEADPVKYLEIQMVGIKAMYSEKVMKLLSILKSENTESSENRRSLEEIEIVEELLEKNFGQMSSFAQRVGQTMGVGKLKGTIADALINFFKAGIDFALSEPVAVSFFTALNPYCRFLAPNYVNEVREYLQSKLNSPLVDSDVYSLIHDDTSAVQPKLWSTRCYKAYYSFYATLTGKKVGHNPNISQMDETFDTATVSSRAKRRKVSKVELDQEQPSHHFADIERIAADTSSSSKRRISNESASISAQRLGGDLSTRNFMDDSTDEKGKRFNAQKSQSAMSSRVKNSSQLRGRLSASTDEVTDYSDDEEIHVPRRYLSDTSKRSFSGNGSDDVAYGLHIEDVEDESAMSGTDVFSKKSGKVSTESFRKNFSEALPARQKTLFAESSQEEEPFEEIISRKSSRYRNR